jgi:hypothetical protein
MSEYSFERVVKSELLRNVHCVSTNESFIKLVNDIEKIKDNLSRSVKNFEKANSLIN